MNKINKKRTDKEPYIDYLVKDYKSFRRLLLDRLCLSHPQFKDPNVADIGLVLIELLAYAADQLSYYQDAVATEAYLGTARKRESIKRHVRLLGYDMGASEDMETTRHIAPYSFVTAQDRFWRKSKRVDEMDEIKIKPKCLQRNEQESNKYPKLYNLPYQDVLSYRVGNYRTFKQYMIYRLHTCENLKINYSENDDFIFELIDAWAIVCDILTFYQERIVNEGYIRTATNRKSIIELCRFVGKELSTGVAADTFLAFTIDEKKNNKIKMPVGIQVQNVPENDELPQIYETVDEIWSSPDWNQIKPLQIIYDPNIPTKGDTIKIDKKIEELYKGQYITISGNIKYRPKKTKSEILKIKDKINNEAQTLILDGKICEEYAIETVTINANVAPATHGETRSEIIGNGDPTIQHQEFMLKYKPLTYVNGEKKGERIHTLQVFVNGIQWNSVDSFVGREPNECCYLIRHDENNNTYIIFGDGKNGARPPHGIDNIRVKYRVGMGLKGMLNSGELNILMSSPYGVRSVSNPLATENAGDPESISEVRNKILSHSKIILSINSNKELQPENFAAEEEHKNYNRIKYGDRLYELLPSIYRQKDEELNNPLKELLQILGELLDIIEENISQMYDNWFIETCEPWVIPYIADVVGIKLSNYDTKDHKQIRALIINSINSNIKDQDEINENSNIRC